jgi:hypothetical protein
MHARDLVELAAIVSAHGLALVESGEPIPAQSIEQYWTTSKVRLDRWAWRLKRFSSDSQAQSPSSQWSGIRGVLEEILIGEMLTRTWTAVLCAYDRRRGTDDAEPVARSVLIGHMEARHRVLTFMVRNQGIDAEEAIKLNRLRRRAERWTDLLVGHLVNLHDVSEFAFDPQRATDFAEDLRHRGNRPGGRHVWPLLMASMRAAFRQSLCDESPNADLNARIAAAILSCFSTELFDSTGLMRSLWMMRLTNIAADTQGRIDELLRLECPAVKREMAGKRIRRFGS